jgi:hypothetical protein
MVPKRGLLMVISILVDSGLVYLLREKINIGIWCNADQFLKSMHLKGLRNRYDYIRLHGSEYIALAQRGKK